METKPTALLPEALLTEQPEVDAQHEEIFVRLEALKDACFNPNANCHDEFERLIVFFEYHFSAEEKLAEEAGLDFSEHSQMHRENLLVLSKLLNEVSNGQRDSYSFLRYIESWFERHITQVDQPFAASLQRLVQSPRQQTSHASQQSL